MFMFASVVNNKEPCVSSINNILVTMAPDEKPKLIQVPGMAIKDPAHG
jgi:hypothetical protein